jgi:hypothetical protein
MIDKLILKQSTLLLIILILIVKNKTKRIFQRIPEELGKDSKIIRN